MRRPTFMCLYYIHETFIAEEKNVGRFGECTAQENITASLLFMKQLHLSPSFAVHLLFGVKMKGK